MPLLIRINLTTQTYTQEAINPGHPLEFYAGRALSSKIVADEVPPHINPLDPKNKLIFACGFLGGTPAPNSGRISVGTKSPLTQGIKESNVGGRTPALLSRQDIRALIIEGCAPEWTVLKIREQQVEFLDGTPYKGVNNYALCQQFIQDYGKQAGLFSIGIAGEKKCKAASIAVIDMEGYPSRHAGRGGTGAVMGSKKLKAIFVIPPKKSYLTYKDEEQFKALSRHWGQEVYQTKRALSTYGTMLGFMTMNGVYGLPTKNFRRGSFVDAEKISGEALHQYIITHGGKFGVSCSPGCMIQCSNIVVGPDGQHLTSSLEYETVALNGSNLMINDLTALARIDHVCDDVGVDTIEIGNATGVYMETGKIKWGDGDAVVRLIEGITTDQPDSLVVAQGAVAVGEHFHIKRVLHVKGQGIAGYDPRTYKGMGVTYITSPQGADHTAGAAIVGRKPYADQNYGEVYEAPRKVEISRDLQIFIMMFDAMGQCYFPGPDSKSAEIIAQLLNFRYGWNTDITQLRNWSKSWLKLERDYNLRVGLPAVDKLPEIMLTEQLEDAPNRKWDIPQNELDHYWDEFE